MKTIWSCHFLRNKFHTPLNPNVPLKSSHSPHRDRHAKLGLSDLTCKRSPAQGPHTVQVPLLIWYPDGEATFCRTLTSKSMQLLHHQAFPSLNGTEMTWDTTPGSSYNTFNLEGAGAVAIWGSSGESVWRYLEIYLHKPEGQTAGPQHLCICKMDVAACL